MSNNDKMPISTEGKKLADDINKEGPWIQMTPIVRVLLEMPEDDALWLRTWLNKAEHGLLIKGDGIEADRVIRMHIREILIQQ